MQKLTITFIYGKDETRKLKYRLTDDLSIGAILEKLIGFQFVIDCADPKTFQVMHKGVHLEDFSKTFEAYGVVDGDEIFLLPTVYEPIPPLPDTPIQTKKKSQMHTQRKRSSSEGRNSQSGERSGSSKSSSQRRRSSSGTASHGTASHGDTSRQEKPAAREASSPQKGTDAKKPIPFKPRRNNYHRSHKRSDAGSSSAPKH